MKDTQAIKDILAELEVKYEHGDVEDDMEFFEIVIDEDEDLVATGLLYEGDEGAAFRLLAPMDRLSEDHPVSQLSLLMALNGELPVGAFCMDPEQQTIYSTVSVSVADLTVKHLGWLLDYIFAVQDFYYQEYGASDTGEN
jgi:hypothetical protein